MNKSVPAAPAARNYDNLVFRQCLNKCGSRDHTNFAGESIHHTVYDCMELCGFKWQLAKTTLPEP